MDPLIESAGRNDDDDAVVGVGQGVLDADLGGVVLLELLDDAAGLADDAADVRDVAKHAEDDVAGGDGERRRRRLGPLMRTVGCAAATTGAFSSCCFALSLWREDGGAFHLRCLTVSALFVDSVIILLV